jgi:hypothetical protein
VPFQDFTELRELFVSNNQLEGGLGPIRGCTLLQELFLGDNNLEGDLKAISGCTRMEVLSLDDNNLTGGLEPLKSCKGVRTLYLAGSVLAARDDYSLLTYTYLLLTSYLHTLQATTSVEGWTLSRAAPHCRRCT